MNCDIVIWLLVVNTVNVSLSLHLERAGISQTDVSCQIWQILWTLKSTKQISSLAKVGKHHQLPKITNFVEVAKIGVWFLNVFGRCRVVQKCTVFAVWCNTIIKLWANMWFSWTHYWAYGEAGNGNEMESGTTNWKWEIGNFISFPFCAFRFSIWLNPEITVVTGV